jgi:thiol-disulfide isomerase/thioredoxin
MSLLRSWVILGSLILAALFSGCDRAAPPPTAPAPAAAVKQLPRIDLEGLQKLIAEAKSVDQVLVLDFWATWCQPCVEMFPGLHEGVVKLGPGARVISITLDDPESEANALAFLEKHRSMKDAWMLVPDTDARIKVVEGIAKEWKNLVVPAILIYDRGGQLQGEFLGDPRVEPILMRVRELLANNPTAAKP